jgi:N-methylhydantoinase A
VLVPPVASVLCAAGMLLTDQQHDFVRSCIARFSELDPGRLEALVLEMAEQGQAQLLRADVPRDRIEHRVALDLRYVKQYHEVTVSVSREAVRAGDFRTMLDAFHREHDRLYGYELSAQGTDLELINVRVRSIGRTDKPQLPKIAVGSSDPTGALKRRRLAFVPERESFEQLPVYDGHRLQAGNAIDGPALIERTDTTIFVSAAYAARVDEHGTCVVRRRAS